MPMVFSSLRQGITTEISMSVTGGSVSTSGVDFVVRAPGGVDVFRLGHYLRRMDAIQSSRRSPQFSLCASEGRRQHWSACVAQDDT
jgi:hypothetical protein